jgi:alpha-ketoglutarate-dependent taurine dioxygenase
VLERLNAALWEVAVAFEWSAGDILCLDNEQAAHGRMSFEPGGQRRVLVALSKL